MELRGVWPALATPLSGDEEIDCGGLTRVTEYCLEGGVYGVVVLGSTGEFPAMTESMRVTAIATVVEAVDRRVPVVAGCGESGTKRTVHQVKALDGSGVQAALVALPFYYPLDQPAVRRFYEAVADVSPLPVVVYNFPQMTKISIAPDTLGSLADHPNVIGVKDSSGDFVGLQNYLAATAGKDFSVMCGNPALGLAAYVHGANGGIFAGASLAPALCVKVFEAFAEGDLATAANSRGRRPPSPGWAGSGRTPPSSRSACSGLGSATPIRRLHWASPTSQMSTRGSPPGWRVWASRLCSRRAACPAGSRPSRPRLTRPMMSPSPSEPRWG